MVAVLGTHKEECGDHSSAFAVPNTTVPGAALLGHPLQEEVSYFHVYWAKVIFSDVRKVYNLKRPLKKFCTQMSFGILSYIYKISNSLFPLQYGFFILYLIDSFYFCLKLSSLNDILPSFQRSGTPGKVSEKYLQ